MSSLLKRSFEALYVREIDFDDAAMQVLWLERRGLGGIAKLAAALPTLVAREESPPAVLTDEPGNCVVDAGGGSLFSVGTAISDIAIAEGLSDRRFHIQVVNCRDAVAIVPGVARCAARGLYAAAWWQDDQTGLTHAATAGPQDNEPDYQIVRAQKDNADSAHTAHFLCGRDPISLPDFMSLNEHQDAEFRIGSREFGECLDDSLQNGMNVGDSDYRALCDVADQVLVEDSDASRRGAGD